MIRLGEEKEDARVLSEGGRYLGVGTRVYWRLGFYYSLYNRDNTGRGGLPTDDIIFKTKFGQNIFSQCDFSFRLFLNFESEIIS